MNVQIHKNYFRQYWDVKDWDNVPEYLRFQTTPSNAISVDFETEEERNSTQPKEEKHD